MSENDNGYLESDFLYLSGSGCSHQLPREHHLGCECVCGPCVSQYQPIYHPHHGHRPAQLATGDRKFRLLRKPHTFILHHTPKNTKMHKLPELTWKNLTSGKIFILISELGSMTDVLKPKLVFPCIVNNRSQIVDIYRYWGNLQGHCCKRKPISRDKNNQLYDRWGCKVLEDDLLTWH